MNAFTERHGALPPNYVPGSQIPLPVILPQRRPKDRTRGFVRAYAPVLENVGIDQATWLAFLRTFQLPSETSPWLAVSIWRVLRRWLCRMWQGFWFLLPFNNL